MTQQRSIVPVVLSGGTGSRLWPLSRSSHPKPFIPLPDGETLVQKTLKRVAALHSSSPILTVTNRDYYFLTRDAFSNCLAADPEESLPAMHYLLESQARNTAPAMAVAALWAQQEIGPDAVLLVLSSDVFEAIRPGLSEEFLKEAEVIEVKEYGEGFIKDIIKEYSGCEPDAEKLDVAARLIAGMRGGQVLVAAYFGIWLGGKGKCSIDDPLKALEEAKKNPEKFIESYFVEYIFKDNEYYARAYSLPLLLY
ncbi:MAG: sugar phosphate nucleotidyltransferase, partial [Candidatus Igneacidithiobacillus chanchocoensis]